MPTPEEANHQARADANAQIEKVNEETDKLNAGNTNKDKLFREAPGPGTEAERLERLRDELEDGLDRVQELINRNQIAAADDQLQAVIHRAESVLEGAGGNAIRTAMEKARKDFRKAKRGITEPPIAAAGDLARAGDAFVRKLTAGRRKGAPVEEPQRPVTA